jgi:hypothetical protein
MLLDFARPDNLVYTNLGMGLALNHRMRAAGHADLLKAAAIIECYHGRGSDELVHRTFKDFGFEQLPFQGFVTNAAFYYMMMLAFVLFELFKKRVCASVIQTTAYASSLRRRLIDIAVKIVRHAGRVILKVPRAVHEQLNFERLWHHQTAPAG